MTIAFMGHDRKKELMMQFCAAYSGILAKHTICATGTSGHYVQEATGLKVHFFLPGEQGGAQQVGARIAYNEIDMVLIFSDPAMEADDADLRYIIQTCDENNVPCATNVATAEMLILGLDRGDLDWRHALHPQSTPFTL